MNCSPRALTCQQLRRLDEVAMDTYGIPGIVLMENAGRGTADLMEQRGVGGRVVICCGSGNNGGDGLVLARQLDGRGYDVEVFVWARPDRIRGDARTNLEIIRRCSIPLHWSPEGRQGPWDELARSVLSAAWIVDGLLGTGARGAPREPMASDIALLNAAPARRIALDIPTGLDGDTGRTPGIVFRADVTATFAALKRGFEAEGAREVTGDIVVVDIGLPADIWKHQEFAESSSG